MWELLVAACGIQFPDQGSNWGPLHRECRVLASGPPRRSHTHQYFSYELKIESREFSGSLVVGISGFHCCSPGSIPAWEASRKSHGTDKKKKKTVKEGDEQKKCSL